MKTLIIDHHAESRKAIKDIVIGFGESEEAKDENEALSIFNKELEGSAPFNLITLDIAMAETNGVELLSKLRELEKKKEIHKQTRSVILIVTAQADRTNIMKAIDKYVRKFGAITIFVEHGIDVENFNEEQIEKMGWVRKEKVRSYI